MLKFFRLLAPVSSALLMACSYDMPTAPLPLRFDRQVHIAQVPLSVTVFNTHVGREQGLMGVPHLAMDQGALFVFEEQQDVVFWMKNTLLALDMLFFDASRRLVHVVHAAEPCKTIPCAEVIGRQTKYVIEANAGFSEKHAISLRSTLMLH